MPTVPPVLRLALVVAAAGAVVLPDWLPNQAVAQGTLRPFTIHAHKYAFDPSRLEVHQDDLVKITLISDDIAHSLTIDAYRIARRVGPGQTTVFEFRVDRPGTFPFYCNLTTDERCKEMHGTLVVSKR
jgi:heme/copper-type cytochrome/quinol oxidase subunit 2